MDLEKSYLRIIKAKYEKPTTNIRLKSGKLKAPPLNSGERQGCPLEPLLFDIIPEVPASAIRQEIKGIHIGK